MLAEIYKNESPNLFVLYTHNPKSNMVKPRTDKTYRVSTSHQITKL